MGIVILNVTAIKLYAYKRKPAKINLFKYLSIFCKYITHIDYEFFCLLYDIFLRLSKAFSKVIASIYSISAPIGIPEANLVIVIPKSFKTLLI